MKIRLLFVSIVLSVFGAQDVKAQDPTQWHDAWGPYFRHLNAVEILPNNKFVAIGGWEFNDAISTVITSTDTAGSWNIAMDGVNAILQDLDFTSATNGYTVGWAGNVWKTTNAGDNWTQITIPGNPGTRNFNGCHFFNDNTGIIVGGNESNDAIRTILKTTDGGANWSIVSDNLAPWLRAVHFADNSTGYAVGDQGTILKSTDGGNNWSVLNLSGGVASRQYNDVYFLNATTGIVVGGWETNDSISTILRTTDGGANWSVIMDNVGSMLNGVYFYSATDGYVVGDDGVIYFTNDAGLTWTPQVIANNNTYGLNAVYFRDAYFGIAVGSDGKLLWYVDENVDLASGTVLSPVTVINSNSVSILGEVDDMGESATLSFEYGTSLSFGSELPMYPYTTSAQGPEDTQVTITGLTADEIYFGRMKMTNALGTSYSNTVSFFTGVTTVPNWNFELWDAFSNDVLDDWFNTGGVDQAVSHDGTIAVELSGNSNDDIGAILYGIPGDSGLEGGIPFTARPDSLIFFAKYDIALGDSAIALLQLKKEGSPIAMHMYKIGGNSGGAFVRKSFKIDYTSVENPDSLILAFTNADPFSGTANPLSNMIIDNVSFYGTTQNVPNADMESWSVETRNKAVSWVSADDFYGQPIPSMVEQSTDAYSGDFAVRLNNKITNEYSDFARIKVGDSLNTWNPVFPVDFNHEKFYGYVKYFPEDGDTLFVRINMFENGNPMGWGELKIKDPILNYSLFEVPISYWGGNADSCLIEFSIYKSNGEPGNSYAILDNLSFDAVLLPTQNVGVEEILPNQISVYPNPTEGPLTIEFANLPQDEISVMVVDLSGRVLLNENHTLLNNQLNININNLPSQYCFVIVREGKFIHSFKTFVK